MLTARVGVGVTRVSEVEEVRPYWVSNHCTDFLTFISLFFLSIKSVLFTHHSLSSTH